jgi:hypothetical protein
VGNTPTSIGSGQQTTAAKDSLGQNYRASHDHQTKLHENDKCMAERNSTFSKHDCSGLAIARWPRAQNVPVLQQGLLNAPSK